MRDWGLGYIAQARLVRARARPTLGGFEPRLKFESDVREILNKYPNQINPHRSWLGLVVEHSVSDAKVGGSSPLEGGI